MDKVFITYIVDCCEYNDEIYFDTLKVFSSESNALDFLKNYIISNWRIIGSFDEVNIWNVSVDNSSDLDICVFCGNGDDFKNSYLKEYFDGRK